MAVKPLNKQNTKFSVNGKLAVLQYGPDGTMQGVKYSHELTEEENIEFKTFLDRIV